MGVDCLNSEQHLRLVEPHFADSTAIINSGDFNCWESYSKARQAILSVNKPSADMTFMKKQQELNYLAHRKRIDETKPNVDCSLPLGMRPEATTKQGKKKQMDRDRYYRKLEKENRTLLERLSKVMQQKNIDNEIRKSSAAKFKEFLTAQARKNHLQRITVRYQLNQRSGEVWRGRIIVVICITFFIFLGIPRPGN